MESTNRMMAGAAALFGLSYIHTHTDTCALHLYACRCVRVYVSRRHLCSERQSADLLKYAAHFLSLCTCVCVWYMYVYIYEHMGIYEYDRQSKSQTTLHTHIHIQTHKAGSQAPPLLRNGGPYQPCPYLKGRHHTYPTENPMNSCTLAKRRSQASSPACRRWGSTPLARTSGAQSCR